MSMFLLYVSVALENAGEGRSERRGKAGRSLTLLVATAEAERNGAVLRY